MKDERDRWSADQLLEHPWIQDPMEDKPKSPAQDCPKDDIDNIIEPVDNESQESEKPLPFYWIRNSSQSRLKSEFSFVCPLGKDGFIDTK